MRRYYLLEAHQALLKTMITQMEEYYIRKEGDEDSRGPFTLDQLSSLVEAEQVEREIARTREAEKVKGYAHDRIELEGVLRIVNHYGAPIHLEVTKVISGELIT